ncbi:MAG: response regulator transcription factor [Nakamurella sp.]
MPIRIALINDYDVILTGIAAMLDPYRERVCVVEIDASTPLHADVDIALYDSFGQSEPSAYNIATLVRNPHARSVVVYTWNFHPTLVAQARAQGVKGYLSKTLPASALVHALIAIHAGEVIFSEAGPRPRVGVSQDWPGREEGLTEREAEILALITQGKANAEIAALTFLSPNTVKSYIRTIYRKINVARRTQAVLWGVDHSMLPNYHRIYPWRDEYRKTPTP